MHSMYFVYLELYTVFVCVSDVSVANGPLSQINLRLGDGLV